MKVNSYSDPQPPVARQARSRNSEARLLEAALTLIRAGGLAQCQVPEVAKRADVAVGTIYRRFRDKEALIEAAFLHALAPKPPGEAVLATPTPDGLAANVRFVVRSFMSQRAADATFYAALAEFVRGSQNVEFRAEIARRRQHIIDILAERLAVAAEQDGRALDRSHITFALHAMTATLRGFVDDQVARPPPWSDLQSLEDGLVRLMLGYFDATTLGA